MNSPTSAAGSRFPPGTDFPVRRRLCAVLPTPEPEGLAATTTAPAWDAAAGTSRKRIPPGGGPGRPRFLPPGFTLLEVVLALSITIGLLVVVLYFYQQAARLRDSTLGATAGLAAVRLCLDRLGTELRTASGQPGSFSGGPRELEFLHCELPEPPGGGAGETPREMAPAFRLRRIRYALPETDDPASGPGLVRTETVVTAATPEPGVESAPPETPDTNDVWTVESTSAEAEGTRITTAFPAAGTAALTLPEIRHLGLRYWDGAAWVDSWSGSSLPRGVEVTLALESVSPDAGPDAVPGEIFRRVIALPAGRVADPESRSAAGTGDGDWDRAAEVAR